MKNIIKNTFLLAFLSIFLFACEEDNTESSTIAGFEPFSISNLTESITVPERAETYVFDFDLDEKQIVDVEIEIGTVSGTATEDSDFSLSSHGISVQALGGGGSFSVTVEEDFLPEGEESVVIRVAGAAPLNYPDAKEVTITIRDSIYPTGVELYFGGPFDFAGDTYDLCSFVDADLFLVDFEGNFAGGFGGATAACPAEFMFTNTLVDGNYDIAANLYDNGLFGQIPDSLAVEYPITVALFKGGVVDNSLVNFKTGDVSGFVNWTSSTPSDPNGEMNLVVGSINVNGETITLFDSAGTEIGAL